jgi:hypothetical protein
MLGRRPRAIKPDAPLFLGGFGHSALRSQYLKIKARCSGMPTSDIIDQPSIVADLLRPPNICFSLLKDTPTERLYCVTIR